MYSFSLYVIKKQKKFLKLYAENISPAPKYSHMLYAFMGKYTYTYKSEHTDYTSFILVCTQMRKYVFAHTHTHTYPSIFIYTLHVNKKIYLKTAFKIE